MVPGGTVARGYGHRHRQERNRWAKVIAQQGGAPCARCGEWIYLGEQWDLGHHDQDRSIYVGPEHQRCNRAVNAPGRGRGTRITSLIW